MRSFFRFASVALGLLLVAMFSALMAMRFAIHGGEVTVPKLVGLSPPEAERAVTNLSLNVVVERQYYSAEVPEGKIMSQIPTAGTQVRHGWQVRVAQSLGPQRVAIPDVLGESERAADLNIRRRGLDLGSISYFADARGTSRSGAGAEPATQCQWRFRPANQLAGNGCVPASVIRNAKLPWPTARQRQSGVAGRGVSRGRRDGRVATGR